MKNLITSSFVVVALALLSCDAMNKQPEQLTADDFETVVTSAGYSMDVPKYMKEASNLNEEASLQYQNLFKETYVIVIDEPKDDIISAFTELGEYDESLSVVKNYRNIQMQLLSEGLGADLNYQPKSSLIGGLEAESVHFDAFLQEVKHDISYFLTFIEGKENVYMVMAWTLKERKAKYQDSFEKMARSFKLLNTGEAAAALPKTAAHADIRG